MPRRRAKGTKRGTLGPLKSVLTEIARVTPTASKAEAESYVCAVCRLPVRACNTNPDAPCTNMLLGGTQLQLLRSPAGPHTCISCGGPIPKKLLKLDPLVELCPRCTPSLSKVPKSKRSKGVSS